MLQFTRVLVFFRIELFATEAAYVPDAGMPMTHQGHSVGPLAGIRILDLSRILAGPTCTQLLGDLGADVIKVERPTEGDDTRKWGPPFLKNAAGEETAESAYYLCANRNKRSIAIDIATPQGQDLVRRLAAECDVIVENFKVGTLEKYGLDYTVLHSTLPRLVYCSITGFGQTGPYSSRSGYDFLAQGMGGIMSITGEPEGEPMKVGVGITDTMTGMYAAVAVLAAVRHRDRSGEGQHIDLALFDTQIAWLINAGTNYLVSGEVPKRLGNAHPNIVPYEVFPTADGHFILAVGNDAQFERFCQLAGQAELAADTRFSTNAARVINREDLIPLLRTITLRRTSHDWLADLEAAQIPAGPVNSIAEAFADPQAIYRGANLEMRDDRALGARIPLIANPIKLSNTPVTYRQAPPRLGEHTREVLAEYLGMTQEETAALEANGTVVSHR